MVHGYEKSREITCRMYDYQISIDRRGCSYLYLFNCLVLLLLLLFTQLHRMFAFSVQTFHKIGKLNICSPDQAIQYNMCVCILFMYISMPPILLMKPRHRPEVLWYKNPPISLIIIIKTTTRGKKPHLKNMLILLQPIARR